MNRYISKSNYGSNMIDISFQSELLKFLFVCHFLLPGTDDDHEKC